MFWPFNGDGWAQVPSKELKRVREQDYPLSTSQQRLLALFFCLMNKHNPDISIKVCGRIHPKRDRTVSQEWCKVGSSSIYLPLQEHPKSKEQNKRIFNNAEKQKLSFLCFAWNFQIEHTVQEWCLPQVTHLSGTLPHLCKQNMCSG